MHTVCTFLNLLTDCYNLREQNLNAICIQKFSHIPNFVPMQLQQSFVVTWVKDTALNGKLVC